MQGLAFIFPGQGAQFVGMGKELAEHYAIARQTFEEANAVLGFDLQKLCYEGDLTELTKTEYAQPAILTASVAAFRVYMEEIGIHPQFAAGHSLGEYSALVSAGALQFADAVRLVHLRGQFMQEAVPLGQGSMMAVMQCDSQTIEAICAEVSTPEEIVVCANYNSEAQIVISGAAAAVERAGEKLQAAGASVKMLNVSAPFHSPLMQPAALKMWAELEKITFGKMQWPVISNVNASPYAVTTRLMENLTNQIVQPVRWHESVDYMFRQGVRRAIEMGPGNVLRKILKRSFPQIEVLALDKPETMEKVKQTIDQPNLKKIPGKCLAVIVCTKNYNDNQADYQKGVVEVYRKIQDFQNQLEEKGTEPTVEEAREILLMLKDALATKQVPVEEQAQRIFEVLDASGTQKMFKDILLPTAS